jgi:hypothetical protein
LVSSAWHEPCPLLGSIVLLALACSPHERPPEPQTLPANEPVSPAEPEPPPPEVVPSSVDSCGEPGPVPTELPPRLASPRRVLAQAELVVGDQVTQGPVELAFVEVESPFDLSPESGPPPMIPTLKYRNTADGRTTQMIGFGLASSKLVGDVRLDTSWSEYPRERVRVRAVESQCKVEHEHYDRAATGAPSWAWMSTVGISELLYGHPHVDHYTLTLLRHEGVMKLRISGFEIGGPQGGIRFYAMVPVRDGASMALAFGKQRFVVEQVIETPPHPGPPLEGLPGRELHLRVRQETWSSSPRWPLPSAPSCGGSTVPCEPTVEQPMLTEPARLWLDEQGTKLVSLHGDGEDIAHLQLGRDDPERPYVLVASKSERFGSRSMTLPLRGDSSAPRIDLGPAIVEVAYDGNGDAPVRVELAWLPHASTPR